MNIRKGIFFLTTCFALCFGEAVSQEYQQTLDIHIPFAPSVVSIGGKPTIYYELHVTNFSADTIDVKSLDVRDAKDSTAVAMFANDDLKKRLARVGFPQSQEKLLAPGSTSVIYVEVILPSTKSTVDLFHILGLEVLRNKQRNINIIKSGVSAIVKKEPVILGPPVSDGNWSAVYGPFWERGHRRVIYTMDGKARIPGRFAIDFIKLDDQGRYVKGDENIISNWYGYGVDVLAVADGVVATTRDDFTESQTISAHPKITAERATGNYISLAIGKNVFAFYEHLKPGSIKVKPGQKVKRGDVIGSIGFTGQTVGPHLHFHIADVNSPLAAEGIPFVFDRFLLLGGYTNFENFGKKRWDAPQDSTPQVISKDHPFQNSVISFDLNKK